MMGEAPSFSGFPEEGLRFLEGLAANNSRDWFQPRKEDYTRTLLEPAQAFVAALGGRLEALAEGIVYDTRTSGSGSILRIYRDMRFSKDKSPYHTRVRIVFWEGPGKKMENPAFYVGIGPDGAGLFSGMHAFPSRC